ncbi:hypothetical protein [Accumulibacter sp.]|uniref:hypothetical protein n=1 Tax=Accumulibacter sp. TaxID=2053492 RepID=UPI0025E14BA1|nr:hypothetical protein [Accumulibacter sp.]MCM8595132.1 hypothetical protein [Accumulibacter sp.]MCM8625518.1 hypothetical protein [Accumulibacter sp.]MDS4049278.1 hypothetical protein [Accumulibacter sp.]
MGAPLAGGNLLARLKAGREAIARVRLGEVDLGLRILTEQDYLEAQIATLQTMQAIGLDLSVGSSEAYEAEKASQLLTRALVDPDTGNPVATSAAKLRAALTRAEQTFLIEAYVEHEQQYSPSPRTLDEAAFLALLEEVKKSPGTTLSSVSSTDTLKRLITALASPPAS